MAQTSTPANQESNSGVFRMFVDEVESSYARTRDVGEYAKRLGYSPRTLSRASQEVQGKSAKDLIDSRVALEAKRLLAHSDLTVAQVDTPWAWSRKGRDRINKKMRMIHDEPPGAF